MDVRRLGNTGLKVTNLCLGTMAFGRWIDESASAQVLDTALEAGINFLDTANVYGRGMDDGVVEHKGESETILGRLLGSRRSKVVLATKVRGSMGPGPNDEGLSRRHIMASVEDSLRRLQTDYIDLYQCHHFDADTDLEETLLALDTLVRQGKVRYIGCSNFTAWQIAKARGISERLGLAKFVSVQPQYSLLVRDAERELLPFSLSEGVGVIPYSPMGRGLLTGKYRKGEAVPEGSRGAAGEQRLFALMSDRNMDLVEAYRSLCAQWGLPMTQVATAWVLANPAVSSAIVGASKPYQVQDAVEATNLRLSVEQKEQLDRLFARQG